MQHQEEEHVDNNAINTHLQLPPGATVSKERRQKGTNRNCSTAQTETHLAHFRSFYYDFLEKLRLNNSSVAERQLTVAKLI